MATVVLNADARSEIGGRSLNRLRKTGYLPAVLYGREIEAEPIVIKLSDLREILAKEGKNAFLTLKLKGKDNAAIVKEIQYNAINGDILHVDLQQVSLTEKIQSNIPVRLNGRENAEKGGFMANLQLSELTIECLPQHTPRHFEIDISHMQVGDIITVGEIEKPEGVTILNEAEEVIVSLIEVKQAAESEAEGEAAAEGGEVTTENADTGEGADE